MRLIVLEIKEILRSLARSPAFSGVVILTIGLGTATNGALLNLADALLLRPLAVDDPESLISVSAIDHEGRATTLSVAAVTALASNQEVLSGLCACLPRGEVTAAINGQLVRVAADAVDGAYFDLMRSRPHVGRLMSASDSRADSSSRELVAVLSFGFWRQHYDQSSNAVGSTLMVEGIPFTIVGVTSPDFAGTQIETQADITIPVHALPRVLNIPLASERLPVGRALGRLRSEVSLDEAKVHLEARWPAARLASLDPALTGAQRENYLRTRISLASASSGSSLLRDRFGAELVVLVGLSALMLLTMTISLAGLLLARAADRVRDVSIRFAMGASRMILVRRGFAEGLTLAGGGTLLGCLLCSWISLFIVSLVWTESRPLELDVAFGWRLAGGMVALAIGTSVVLGLAPSLLIGRVAASLELRGIQAAEPRVGAWGRRLLVAQMGLSLALISGAGLLVRSLQRLEAVDVGFNKRGVELFRLLPRPDGYETIDDSVYYPELQRRIVEAGQVRSAAFMRRPPASNIQRLQRVGAEGEQSSVTADMEVVSPGFFETLGIPLEKGRGFAWSDNTEREKVAIVSNALAQRLFLEGEALNRLINVGDDETRQRIRTIGVTSDARLFNPRSAPAYQVFLSTQQEPGFRRWPILAVGVVEGLPPVAEPVRTIVRSQGVEFVAETWSLTKQMERSTAREVVMAKLSLLFALVSMLLVLLGVYGVVTYRVSRRAPEIGLRMALGASRQRIHATIVRDSLVLGIAGVLVGVPLAAALERGLRAELFELTTTDWTVFAGAGLLILAVTLVGTMWPAVRASRTPPLVSLRQG